MAELYLVGALVVIVVLEGIAIIVLAKRLGQERRNVRAMEAANEARREAEDAASGPLPGGDDAQREWLRDEADA
jgi:hypothetical protein